MRIIKPPKRGERGKSQEPNSHSDSMILDGYEVIDAGDLKLDARSDGSKRSGKKGRSSMERAEFRNDRQGIDKKENSGDAGGLDRNKEYSRLLNRGVRLLAMREHSVKEIYDKLSRKSEMPDVVNAVLDELLANKYVSDERFTESYIRARSNRGFGPIKIRAELKDKGISNSLVAEYLDMSSPIWIDLATAQYQKKYGAEGVSDYNTWTKRARFMQSRGFTMEHIRVALPEIEFD